MKMQLSEVKVRETWMVRPADAHKNAATGRRMRVSDIDLLHVRYHMKTVHTYGGPVGPARETARTLRDALSRVMTQEYYYPVAGRLARDDDGRIEIECNSEGVMFSWAETDSTIDQLGEVTPNSDLSAQLVPAADTSGDISSFPLLLCQVTFFKCGGMCLGMGLHHILADGLASMHFVNSWAIMARGAPVNSPILDRGILCNRALPSPKFPHPEFDSACTIFKDSAPSTQQVVPSTAALGICFEQIRILKAKANTNPQNQYSSYEVVLAHVWRCACKARGLRDDQVARMYFAVNARSRLVPPVSELFFGNVAFTTVCIAVSGDLAKESISCTAGRLRGTIRRMDDEYMRSQLAYLEHNPESLECRQGDYIFRNPNLSIVSWSRISMNDADFGWGPPAYVGPAKIGGEGKGYVTSNASNCGGLSLFLTLEAHHMKVFKDLFYDLK